MLFVSHCIVAFSPHDFALRYPQSGDTWTHFTIALLTEDNAAPVDIIHNLSILQPWKTFLKSGYFLTF